MFSLQAAETGAAPKFSMEIVRLGAGCRRERNYSCYISTKYYALAECSSLMRPAILFIGVLLAGTLPVGARAANLKLPGKRLRLCQPGTEFCPVGQGFSLRSRETMAAGHFSLDAGEQVAFKKPFSLKFSPGFDPSGGAGSGEADAGAGNDTQQQAYLKKFSPGESTPFGQHVVEWTLLTAPIAAYALSPALDRRLHYDGTGIWKRQRQLDFEYAVILGEVGGSLWFGGQSRIGRTFWRSIDASLYTAVTVQAMKYAFSRARPEQSSSPNHWFQGNCCQSFPSGEVSFQASAVTPFIAEYHKQYPWVWALEAFPAYDAWARMKTHGHWQTDVLAAWAIGTAWGLYAHFEPKPLFLSIMPHGIMVGIHVYF